MGLHYARNFIRQSWQFHSHFYTTKGHYMELKLDTTFEVKYPTFLFAKFMWFILQIETNFDIMCRLDNLAYVNVLIHICIWGFQ